MPASRQEIAFLRSVNDEVNQLPFVETPGPTEPVDYWSYLPEPGKSFVCRDYTEGKAQRLREAGWPPLSLTVILCWTEPVGNPQQRWYHAVLGVDCGGETWILDNRQPDIYWLDQPPAPYLWDRRQIAGTVNFQAYPRPDGRR